MHNIPEGFEVMSFNSAQGHMTALGPFYVRRAGDRVRIGTRVEQRHCNQYGNAHGGMITTLSDVLTGFAVVDGLETMSRMATVSLNTDFLDSVPLGCWLDGWGELQRMGGSLAYARCEMFADGKIAARANGIFKVWPAKP